MKIIDWNGDRKQLLPLLWTFLTVNYIFCDVFTLHLAKNLEVILAGGSSSMPITEEFLLIFAVIMQIPMIMIPLSLILVSKLNKYSNIIAGFITTAIHAYTVTLGGTLHYMFFSFFEICTGLLIIYLAYTWKSKTTS